MIALFRYRGRLFTADAQLELGHPALPVKQWLVALPSGDDMTIMLANSMPHDCSEIKVEREMNLFGVSADTVAPALAFCAQSFRLPTPFVLAREKSS